jgi:RNase P/RNase MRP subunit p30
MEKERIILKPMDFNKLKNEVKKNKDKEIIFASGDDELNRKVMEKLKVDGVLIYLDERKDYMKQRDSGFNEVMARIAKKKKLAVYFDLDEVFDSKYRERVLSRLKQNIDLCNRVSVPIKVVVGKNKRDEFETKALFASLGAPTWMLKSLF